MLPRVRRAGRILKRAGLKFYDDQMTQHAGALTYYSLMSLFPALLLGLSLLGLIGEYPATYDAIVGYLRGVVPEPVLTTVDESLRQALERKGTATTALIVSIVVALYGTTGALESARRALNIVFEAEGGRSFLRRKAIDIGSTIVLMALVLMTLTLMFVGGRLARRIFDLLDVGDGAVSVWGTLRWPAAVLIAMLIFALVYYVTPDVRHRGFRWITPGAVVGVALWIGVSAAFGRYISDFADVSAVYGAFAGAIVLVAWLWLSGVALLFGAELNAEIEREKQMSEGVPPSETLDLPQRG
jgi:membrane protein